MKYKIKKGTETFKKLVILQQHIKEVESEAFKIVESLGATKYCKAFNKLAGGISAIRLEKKPEGFKNVDKDWRMLFYPKASNKKVCKEIESLPTIKYDELNNIIGFEAPQTVSCERGIGWVNTVGLIFGKDFMLLDVENGCVFKPNKDTIEILESEYQKLKSKLNN